MRHAVPMRYDSTANRWAGAATHFGQRMRRHSRATRPQPSLLERLDRARLGRRGSSVYGPGQPRGVGAGAGALSAVWAAWPVGVSRVGSPSRS
jgi:hypothetical protein